MILERELHSFASLRHPASLRSASVDVYEYIDTPFDTWRGLARVGEMSFKVKRMGFPASQNEDQGRARSALNVNIHLVRAHSANPRHPHPLIPQTFGVSIPYPSQQMALHRLESDRPLELHFDARNGREVVETLLGREKLASSGKRSNASPYSMHLLEHHPNPRVHAFPTFPFFAVTQDVRRL
jgi:hypothetical protein